MAGRQIVWDDLFQRLPSLSQSSKIIKDTSIRRGIRVYIEHQSVCPFVGIGSPFIPQTSVATPLGHKWGETHALTRGGGEWVGGPNYDEGTETLVLFLCKLLSLYASVWSKISVPLKAYDIQYVVTVVEINMIMRFWSKQKVFFPGC